MKVMKFHGILHLTDDVLRLGVPNELDTGSNESHHIDDKACAKNTQKNIATFEQQTASRIMESFYLELAEQELDGKALFDYYSWQSEINSGQTEKKSADRVGGAWIGVVDNAESGEYVWDKVGSKLFSQLDNELLQYLGDLQEHLSISLEIRTEHCRNGQMFRGNPKYRGAAWNDWASFDWGRQHGASPGHVMCFVDLTELYEEDAHTFQQSKVCSGVFAVIEWAEAEEESDEWTSNLFIPINKRGKEEEESGKITERMFYLADVEAIVDPLVVVPDVNEAKPNRFFKLCPRKEWGDDFILWLEAPFHREEADIHTEETPTDPPASEEEPEKKPSVPKKTKKRKQ